MGSLVSLVMSDIVDSTRRWNADEAAMAADLEAHDRLVRGVVEAAAGTVFKHTGDGMIAVFDDPVAAVGAATSIQQAIGAAAWQHADGVRVRAAVHTGVVYPRDGDLFGTAVNRLARLLGACPAGAVLVSSATAALLTDRAPEGLQLRPVGAVSLAGFASPDHAHAVAAAGIADVGPIAPPAASGNSTDDDHGGNGESLPPVEGDLVGRADELMAVWDALDRSPLVTLVGVGGMGKTRLALEVASTASAATPAGTGDGGHAPSGAWWIDLTAATSDTAVVPAAMAAVGAREAPGRTPLQSFTDRFTTASGVVVVDNCEHVLDAARELVTALIAACPKIRVVCTSREALGLRREQLVPIGSLPADDGVVLFCERARAVRPDLDVDAAADVIRRMCTRLDGIPLAIELAAARCRSMSPAEIDDRLDDRFRLLRGGRSGAERHRTLRATVEWSYAALDDDEREVFDQMAVFAGGTLIDGLTAVTGLDEFDLIDIVDRLVSRSMVVAAATPLGTRYHQLETLRQFAEDRLVETDTIGQVRDRHLAWMFSFARGLPRRGDRNRIAATFSRFAAEVDNLRVAVAHALGTGQHDRAHSIVAAVARYAFFRPVFEVFDWVRPLALNDDSTADAALCAAYGTYADFFRGGKRLQLEPLGGVPARFCASNLPVATLQALALLQSGGDWRHALSYVDSFPDDTTTARLIIGRTRLLATFYRQFAETVPADELAELVAEGDVLLALARQVGDPIELSTTLHYFAWALTISDLDRALVVAREAAVQSRGLGAAHLSDTTQTVERYAMGLLMRHTTPTVEQLLEIRGQLAELLERRHLFPAAVHTVALMPLLLTVAPDVAKQVNFTWTDYTGLDYFRLVHRVGIEVDPETMAGAAALERAELPDTIAAVLATLDRIIADRSA